MTDHLHLWLRILLMVAWIAAAEQACRENGRNPAPEWDEMAQTALQALEKTAGFTEEHN